MDPALIARIGADISDLRSKMGEAGGVLGGFQNHVAKMGPMIAAAFSVGAIVAFGKAALTAAGEAVDGENKLLVALKGRKDIQQSLIKQADNLASRTLFEDDDIIRQQGLLAAMGRTEEQIRDITDAAVQLSAATGTDLAIAYEALNKSLAGTDKGLKAIDLGGMTQAQLRHGDAVRIVGEKYSGFAENLANAGSGPLKTFEKTFGELMEEMGKLLLPSTNAALAGFTATIKSLTDEDVSKWDRFKGVMLALWNGNPANLANLPKSGAGGKGAQTSWGPPPAPPSVARKAGVASYGEDPNVKDEMSALTSGATNFIEGLKDSAAGLQEGVIGPLSEMSDFMTDIQQGQTDFEKAQYQERLDAFQEAEHQKAVAAERTGQQVGKSLGAAVTGQKSYAQSVLDSTRVVIKAFYEQAIAGLAKGAFATGNPLTAGFIIAAGMAVIDGIFASLSSGGGGGGAGGGVPQTRENAAFLNGNTQSIQITGRTRIEGNALQVLWERTNEGNSFTKPSLVGG